LYLRSKRFSRDFKKKQINLFGRKFRQNFGKLPLAHPLMWPRRNRSRSFATTAARCGAVHDRGSRHPMISESWGPPIDSEIV